MKILNLLFAVLIFTTPQAMAQGSDFCAVYNNAQSDANYVEGVDVHGNSVVPADLNATQRIEAPKITEIPLTIDLAEKLNLSLSGLELKPELGKIQISQNGDVTFNGKNISSNAKTLCAETNNIITTPFEVTKGVMNEEKPLAPLNNQAQIPQNVPLQKQDAPLPSTVSPSVTRTE